MPKYKTKDGRLIDYEICTGCGETWPINDLGAYTLCPNCASVINDHDERTPRLTGVLSG